MSAEKLYVAEGDAIIHAPREKIWAIMTDFSGYGEWNPFIVRIDLLHAPGYAASGIPMHGDRVRLRLKWENGRRGQSAELVETVQPGSQAGEKSLLSYRFDGLLAAFVPLQAVWRAFSIHAAALKKACEA